MASQQQMKATADYLRSIGVDPDAALGSPPTLDSIQPERTDMPTFVGPVNPELEYFRANRTNTAEVKRLLEVDGYAVADQSIKLDGCSTPDDLTLVRRPDVGIAIERRRYEARRERRRGGIAGRHNGIPTTMRSPEQRTVRLPEDLKTA